VDGDSTADLLQTVLKLKRAKPFKPFVIRRHGKTDLVVEDACHLAVTATSVHVAVGGSRMTDLKASEIDAVELVRETPESRMLETILTLKHREPFVQFNILLNSGDRYLVENPDLLAVGKSELAYYFPRSNRVVFIRTNQIVAVEQLEERPAA
jgi:hypothetical protein